MRNAAQLQIVSIKTLDVDNQVVYKRSWRLGILCRHYPCGGMGVGRERSRYAFKPSANHRGLFLFAGRQSDNISTATSLSRQTAPHPSLRTIERTRETNMAGGRPMGKLHQEDVRKKIQVSQLIKVLQDHALTGEGELAPTRMKAIEILLRKSMPDLSAVTLEGTGEGGAFSHSVSIQVVGVPANAG